MRKKPSFQNRICQQCGSEFTPVGPSQIYCVSCGKSRSELRKRAFYEKMHPDRKPKQRSSETCAICGAPFSSHYDGLPYCNLHYQRMRHHGTPNPSTRCTTTTYNTVGAVTYISTNNGAEFIIDTEDLEIVKKYSWCLGGKNHPYMLANIRGKVTALHRYLLNPPSGKFIDHINGNPLDNRRCNLRICSPVDNARNTSSSKNSKCGVLGVSLTPSGRYRARIMVNRKEIRLGNFKTLEEAIAARKSAETEYFGDFAPSASRHHDD